MGLVVLPLLGQSLLPNFKERDFLMHWLGKPDISLQEEVRTTKQVNAELLTDPRRAQRRIAHRQRVLRRRAPRRVLRGELDQRRQVGRLRRDREQRPRCRRRLSRRVPRRTHLPEGTDPGGPDRDERPDHDPDLRARPGDPADEGRGDQRDPRRHPGRGRDHTSTSRTHPAGPRSRSTWRRREATG